MNSIKLVVLGSGCVGKSSLTIRYVHNEFIDKYDPTIEDMYRKVVELNGDHFMLEIMDTAGTETFLAMRDLYIRNGQAFMLVYSITSRTSFQELEQVKDQILRVKDVTVAKLPIIVVGNKSDLEPERQVSSQEGENLSSKWGIQFLETSAKTNMNITAAFEHLVAQVQKKTLGSKRKDRKRINFCQLLLHNRYHNHTNSNKDGHSNPNKIQS
ncbi:Ras GTPase [Heterostelium album PN500]|uniref:small monomeric GTPase n=1 Tax=Heterostelium pallidum (strain ATCC 26659 / Pp 5 / PN500) TaxID=670386 RepID=D3AZM0_HETP5|nr:Ras GTPase [Heterostelium album PN500]EFA85399.1 Ras GTPase [Heterostelium album PN500]|eukprot:XP_020437508.1 Ras GTPase [Heterostelium album PN500]